MSLLAEPIEYLDLKHGESVSFGVVRYQLGETSIVTRDANEAKTIPTLRVYVRPGDKRFGMPYWDISSKMLQAQIMPFLVNAATRGKVFTVTANGVRPSKRFALEAA